MFVTSKKMTAAVLAITLAMSLSACSTLGGAAVGGVIGHQVGK
ncbi:MAG: hypothetical protein E6964_06170 [Escherichia coli]|nr:hypothetical protein [Escherichia coli]